MAYITVKCSFDALSIEKAINKYVNDGYTFIQATSSNISLDSSASMLIFEGAERKYSEETRTRRRR